MMSNGDLDPLYKDRPIALWVEDGLTRDYLTAAWDDPKQIRLLIAGDSTAVGALVKSARRMGYGAVFGLCDRDFGPTNCSSWSTSTEVFRLQMHEIENALLAPRSLQAALARLGRARSEHDLRTRIRDEATKAVWGMALGRTLSWIRTELHQDFPPSTSLVEVDDRDKALARIVASGWWTARLPLIRTTLTSTAIGEQLDQAHAACQSDLGSDAYLSTFAGKELLGRCWSWLVQQGTGPHPTKSDLAKAVGAAQRDAEMVPQEIEVLRNTLLGAL